MKSAPDAPALASVSTADRAEEGPAGVRPRSAQSMLNCTGALVASAPPPPPPPQLCRSRNAQTNASKACPDFIRWVSLSGGADRIDPLLVLLAKPVTAAIWSALTCQRFDRGDVSPTQCT